MEDFGFTNDWENVSLAVSSGQTIKMQGMVQPILKHDNVGVGFWKAPLIA